MEVYALIGVLLGFYLAKYQEINKKVAESIIELKKSMKKDYGEPFVVRTDEADLERRQNEEKGERIFLKDILKK